MVDPIAPLIRLAATLHAEGRSDDAQLLLGESAALAPDRLDFREALVELAISRERTVEGLEALVRLIEAGCPRDDAIERFSLLLERAFAECQAHYDREEAAEAMSYLTPLTDILPDHVNVHGMALSCSRFLGMVERSESLMRRLLELDPGHSEGRLEMIDHLRRVGDLTAEVEWRHALMMVTPPTIPKVNQINNAYELINLTICDPLTQVSMARIDQAREVLEHTPFDPSAERGVDAWTRFYRAMASGIDFTALGRPPAPAQPPGSLAGCDGNPMNLSGLRALAARQGAEAVFLVAADEVYAADYARLYVRSVLRNAGLPVLVIVHIAGGAGKLAAIAQRIGVADDRLVFSADDFDPTAVTSQVLDAVSQPRITKPAAHYQSARFHQAPWILSELGLPLFITDIDCLLERDIRDLVALRSGTDLLLNENVVMRQLGARITANLLLLFPTPASEDFARFVSSYLAAMLTRPDIPKFIDQIALLMGRHYMEAVHPEALIGYFDVETDINNCMYMEYYQHPFRFLSLYRGFDLDSLPEWHRGD